MTAIHGRQIKVPYNKRCDWIECTKGPIKFGYQITEGPTQGFFCGPRHWIAAREHMEQIKKETGIKTETDAKTI